MDSSSTNGPKVHETGPAETPRALDRAVNRLADYGLDATKIADALGVPIDQIHGSLTISRRVQSPAEKEIADQARTLAVQVIKRAQAVLQFGAPDHRLAIMKAVLPNAMRTLGVEAASEHQEVRMQLDNLFTSIRSVTPSEPLVTPTDIIDVKSEASSFPAED